MTYSRVYTDNNWREVDMDEFGEFTNGEHVHVRWPDGSITREVVEVQKFSYRESEQGSPWGTTIHVRRAFVTLSVNGAPAKVGLTGLEVERIEQ